MIFWNPFDIFNQNPNLKLSPAQIAAIRSKMPPAEDGNFYADAVFEGGGVKGTAFLGALRCFDDAGVTFRKVAGTSAGAITAALVAAGFTLDELERIMGLLDYMNDLLKQKTSPFIFNGTPDDDLKHPFWMGLHLWLVGQQGQYSSEPFWEWLNGKLARKGISSFASIKPKSEEWYDQRELRVVISDISQKAMRVLPTDLQEYGESPDTFNVAEAVRLSMSIPFFFQPGKLGESTIVDGGILSNFPLWIYDAPAGEPPHCPTFGFRLVEENPKPKPINSAMGIFKNMLSTMQVANDRHYLDTNNQGRVIEIGTMGISTTQFNLTNADKNTLYKEGYEKAKTFLLEQWDWKKHLETRGFTTNSKARNSVVAIAQGSRLVAA